MGLGETMVGWWRNEKLSPLSPEPRYYVGVVNGRHRDHHNDHRDDDDDDDDDDDQSSLAGLL